MLRACYLETKGLGKRRPDAGPAKRLAIVYVESRVAVEM